MVSLQLPVHMVRHALLRHVVKMCLCQHWFSLEFVMTAILQGFLMVLLLGCVQEKW